MRHRVAGKKLSRDTGQRRALRLSLAIGLLNHGRITTTEAKARAVRADAEKLITSAEILFSASSKERRVLVLFSKNRLAMVISRREGTFLIGRLITSLN